jgi:hypothetical protein
VKPWTGYKTIQETGRAAIFQTVKYIYGYSDNKCAHSIRNLPNTPFRSQPSCFVSKHVLAAMSDDMDDQMHVDDEYELQMALALSMQVISTYKITADCATFLSGSHAAGAPFLAFDTMKHHITSSTSSLVLSTMA